MATKRVLKCLSVEEKYKLLREVEGGGLKKKEAAEKYRIPASTVSTILKNKESIIKSFESGSGMRSKRIKTPKFQNIDKAVLDWFRTARLQRMPISATILKAKAMEFAKHFGDDHFMASTGWLAKWKQRHAVDCEGAWGGANGAGDEDCEKWRKYVLPNLLQNYQEQDVFNADEAGLFYKCLPDKTLAFRNQKCCKGENSKQRVTLMLAANMDGSEKLKMLLIGKSVRPRCLRGMKQLLPVDYKANSKAWMTSQLFEEWIMDLDKQFQRSKRKILLFIDDCPAHPKDLQSKLKSIELAFFPPNMRSKLQPLEQGVFQNLKLHYRSRMLKEALKRIDNDEKQNITLLDCINHVTKAWDTDVSSQTVANCFKKAGFGRYSGWSEDEVDDIALNLSKLSSIDEYQNIIEADYEAWRQANQITDNEYSLRDYIEVDGELCTTGLPTCEDIVEQYRRPESDDPLSIGKECDSQKDSQEEGAIHQPSRNDVENALRTLASYLHTNDHTTNEHYKALNKLESFFFTENNKITVKSEPLISEFCTSP